MTIVFGGYNIAVTITMVLLAVVLVAAYIQRKWKVAGYGHIALGAFMVIAGIACLPVTQGIGHVASLVVLGIGAGGLVWGIILSRRDTISPVKKVGKL